MIRSVTRPTTVVLAVLLGAGCSQDITVSDVQKVLAISPLLLDLGDVRAGETKTAEFVLDNLAGGDIEVRRVDLSNLEGEAFSFEGEPPVIEQLGFASLEVTYSPDAPGYHYAIVTVTSDAATTQLQADVRGRAVEPVLDVWPRALDFGAVAVESTRTLEIEVTNYTPIAVSLDAFEVDEAAFSVETALPVVLEPDEEVRLTVSCSPTSADKLLGELLLSSEGTPVPAVQLRANDCDGGIPENYDLDGDGVTSCAGDCDDDDPLAYPGRAEVPNGVDDDCDNTVDEGTLWYDDDGDGYCEAATCSDGSLPADCNDAAATVNPGADEVFENGIDDDCDGTADSGSDDGDGDGYTSDAGDCDDADATRHPGATEAPDTVDNDCDGEVDEGTVMQDDDWDGYCEHPSVCLGTLLPGDCDDGSYVTNPGADELADWRDNDCDGDVDEDTENSDDDGDGYTETGGDCDDGDAMTNPGLGNC